MIMSTKKLFGSVIGSVFVLALSTLASAQMPLGAQAGPDCNPYDRLECGGGNFFAGDEGKTFICGMPPNNNDEALLQKLIGDLDGAITQVSAARKLTIFGQTLSGVYRF
jgi:hypothetical protein